LARLYNSQGKLAQAEPLYQEALAMSKRLFSDDHPDVAQSLNNLAFLYQSQGKLAQAESLCQEALAMSKCLFPDDHPSVATSLNSLAFLYQSQGKLAQAESLCQQALAMRKRLFPTDHPSVATSLNNLAALYQSQGKLAQAEPLLQEALAMWKLLFPTDHPNIATSLNNLAVFLAATDRYSEALERMKEAAGIENRLISQAFAASSERDRLTYLQLFRTQFEAFLSLVYQHLHHSPEAKQAALDLVLQRKALTAAASAALNQAIYSGRYPHLKPELEKLRELSDEIIHFTFTQPQPELIGQLQAERDKLQQQLASQVRCYSHPHLKPELEKLRELSDEIIHFTFTQPQPELIGQLQAEHNKLQQQLASQIPEIQLQEQPIGCCTVALELPTGSTLIEFVCFDVFNFHATSKESQWQPARYLAFILSLFCHSPK